MAIFAQLDNNDIVMRTLIVNDDVITDSNGIQQESIGIEFLKTLYGAETVWVQTSESWSFRKQLAHPNYFYNRSADVFVQPKSSWPEGHVLDEDFDWVHPTEI